MVTWEGASAPIVNEAAIVKVTEIVTLSTPTLQHEHRSYIHWLVHACQGPRGCGNTWIQKHMHKCDVTLDERRSFGLAALA